MSTIAIGSAASRAPRISLASRSLVVTDGSAPSAAQGAQAPVRLTRRGRLLVTLLLTLLVVAALGTIRHSVSATSRTNGPVGTYLTVESGQTLWQIAGLVAPGKDRRDTVARIIELNDLSSARIAVGQRLAVPLR